jgi:hypothetical protein
MDSILEHFNLPPGIQVHIAKPNARARREFRGDRDQVTLQPDLTYAWVPSLLQFRASIPQQCEYVTEKYEEHVAKYACPLLKPH